MIPAGETTGVILAGGRSSRMGRDKALINWRGRPLIMHVHDVLASRFTRLLLSAPAGVYDLPGVASVADEFPGAGPLAGIHAVLTACTTPHVFVAACDMPRVVPEMIDALLAAAGRDRITVCSDGVRIQPLFGVYPTAVREMLRERLVAGHTKMLDILGDAKAGIVDLSRWKEHLTNVNSADDLPRSLTP